MRFSIPLILLTLGLFLLVVNAFALWITSGLLALSATVLMISRLQGRRPTSRAIGHG